MIRSNWRYLSPDERKKCQTKNPFHILTRSDKWQERKEGTVEVLEFDAKRAWNLWGCDRGPGCCPGGILVRTRDKEFIYLSGRVSRPVYPPSDYHFSFQSFDQLDGTRVVIERWPKTKGIYSARFSGDPIPYVHVSAGDPLWSVAIFTRLPCEIVANETIKDLPEALLQELLRD